MTPNQNAAGNTPARTSKSGSLPPDRVAEIIRASGDSQQVRRVDAERMADYLVHFYPTFDRERFIAEATR